MKELFKFGESQGMFGSWQEIKDEMLRQKWRQSFVTCTVSNRDYNVYLTGQNRLITEEA